MLKGKYIAILIMFLFMHFGFVAAQPVIDQEYKLKAAYLYKFTKYIDWNREQMARDTFYIGVLGDSEIRSVLNRIANRKYIKNKPVIVHYYNRIEDFIRPDGSTPNINPHILFISKKVVISEPEKLAGLAKRNILLVGEQKDFATTKGGLINFTIQRNKLKFGINYNAMINCGFKVSPQLLKLAILVNEKDVTAQE